MKSRQLINCFDALALGNAKSTPSYSSDIPFLGITFIKSMLETSIFRLRTFIGCKLKRIGIKNIFQIYVEIE